MHCTFEKVYSFELSWKRLCVVRTFRFVFQSLNAIFLQLSQIRWRTLLDSSCQAMPLISNWIYVWDLTPLAFPKHNPSFFKPFLCSSCTWVLGAVCTHWHFWFVSCFKAWLCVIINAVVMSILFVCPLYNLWSCCTVCCCCTVTQRHQCKSNSCEHNSQLLA